MTETNQTNLAGVNRPIQIIPSVLPADWANMGACVKAVSYTHLTLPTIALV